MQKKKKLLFVCNNLHIGGIQRSLLNLLEEISDKYDVTLFLFYPKGEYAVPKNVRVISAGRFAGIMGMSQSEAADEGLFAKLWRGLWVIVTRIFGCGAAFSALCSFEKIKEEFDAAISFMQNSDFHYFYGGCNEFVIKSVYAKKKISFVHCDFEHYFGNNKYNREYYRNFDAVACVSDSCRKAFTRACPGLADKTVTVHNCFNFDEMRTLSSAFSAQRSEQKINIFTSARISEEKGILRMIGIFGRLKEKGYEFVWRIAGDGAKRGEAQNECKKYGLGDDIIFLGWQENPYPYFKTADLVLVPSYDEAAPMAFGEAQTFGVPILTTDTVSAKELVGDKGVGYVCGNSDDAIENALEELLKNPKEVYNKRYISVGDNGVAVREFEDVILAR